MKAVLHTGRSPDWVRDLGLESWALAPVAGRTLLEYWIEWCDRFGLVEVHLVLGDGAQAVESFAGDGARWGRRISYSFAVGAEALPDLLQRESIRSPEGLLYVGAPFFPRWLTETPAAPGGPPASGAQQTVDRQAGVLVCANAEALQAFLAGQPPPPLAPAWRAAGLELQEVTNLREYFDLNLRLVRGEISRYVQPGYLTRDGASIGYNVILPPAVQLQPPLIIGNDTQISPLSVIGPEVIIGNACIVDRQTSVRSSVVLDGTYVGQNLELRDKIISGTRIIDPASGAVLDLDDPLLVGRTQATFNLGDPVRALLGWWLALPLVLAQALPFGLALLLRLPFPGALRTRWTRRRFTRGRVGSLLEFTGTRASLFAGLFFALGLDRFPALLAVLAGRLWLCGQEPLDAGDEGGAQRPDPPYFPAAFSYAAFRDEPSDELLRRVDALYYAHHRSVREDLQILRRTLLGRLTGVWPAARPEGGA